MAEVHDGDPREEGYCPKCGARVGTVVFLDPRTGESWIEPVDVDHEECNDLMTGEEIVRIVQQTFCPYRTHWCGRGCEADGIRRD